MNKLLCLLFLLPAYLQAQTIHISTVATTVCIGTHVIFTATDTGISSPHFQWKVNNVLSGTDSSTFTASTLTNGDSVKCLLTNGTGDTVFAVSNGIGMTVQTMPNAGVITGIDLTVCVGATITLSDTMPGGIWKTSNGHASVTGGIVTGLSIRYVFEYNVIPSADTILYIKSNSCGSDTAFKTISINAKPIAMFDLPYSMCEKQHVSLVNGNGNFQNLFSINGDVVSMGSDLYGVKAGNDYLYNIVHNICGSDTFGQAIRVDPLPVVYPIQAQTTELCPNEQLTLTDSGIGDFHWYSNNGNASVGPWSGVVTALIAGYATIILDISNYCGLARTSISIQIDPPKPILNTGEFCEGSRLELADSTKGGSWSSANPAITNMISSSGIVTAISPGIDTIFYRLPNGCTAKASVTVNPLPAPISGESITCKGSSITLTNTDNGKWRSTFDSVATVDSLYGEVKTITKGYATIKYILPSGCYDSVNLRVVNCDTAATIFPNPSVNEVIIQVDTIYYNHYFVINMSGQVLINEPIIETLTKVNTGLLIPGTYLVYLTGDNMTYYTKFVKE